jgi:hypothetical protein
VRYYLTMQTPGLARSCAPLDVTMRRAAVMMKPYFIYFRNYYPLSSQLFYVAHWWHPAAYESQMIAGNAPAAQEASLQATIATMWQDFMPEDKRPKRMVLSREIMPRYNRMSPESANIFDNLHMLHGIVYDCLAYPHWSIGQKRDELYRVIQAMAYQPGDEAYVRSSSCPIQNGLPGRLHVDARHGRRDEPDHVRDAGGDDADDDAWNEEGWHGQA